MDEDLGAIRSVLESVIERLDELAFEVLVASAAEGRGERPELDRKIVRARRSIERAVALLREE